MEKIRNATKVTSAIVKDAASNLSDKHLRREIYWTSAGAALYGGIACVGTAAFISVIRSERGLDVAELILGTAIPAMAASAAYVKIRMGFNQTRSNYKADNWKRLKEARR